MTKSKIMRRKKKKKGGNANRREEIWEAALQALEQRFLSSMWEDPRSNLVCP